MSAVDLTNGSGFDLQIREFLLDSQNLFLIDGVTVSERIRRGGGDHLWGCRSGAPVDTVVIHYMSAAEIDPANPYDFEKIIAIFCECGVSSHFLIERTGGIIRLVPEKMKAWHAGGSIMPLPDRRTGVNDFSIGIELAATHDSGFTTEQYASLIALCRSLRGRLGKDVVFVGHEHIAGSEAVALGLRAEAKMDPGPLFDWMRLRDGLNA